MPPTSSGSRQSWIGRFSLSQSSRTKPQLPLARPKSMLQTYAFFHFTVKEAKRYLNAEAPTAVDEDDNGKGDEEESSDGDD